MAPQTQVSAIGGVERVRREATRAPPPGGKVGDVLRMSKFRRREAPWEARLVMFGVDVAAHKVVAPAIQRTRAQSNGSPQGLIGDEQSITRKQLLNDNESMARQGSYATSVAASEVITTRDPPKS